MQMRNVGGQREEPPQQRGTTNCQNTERPPQTQQTKQYEKQRNTQQVTEHDKCPPNKTQEEEIGSLPEKKIQNNDSKNDPKS